MIRLHATIALFVVLNIGQGRRDHGLSQVTTTTRTAESKQSPKGHLDCGDLEIQRALPVRSGELIQVQIFAKKIHTGFQSSLGLLNPLKERRRLRHQRPRIQT